MEINTTPVNQTAIDILYNKSNEEGRVSTKDLLHCLKSIRNNSNNHFNEDDIIKLRLLKGILKNQKSKVEKKKSNLINNISKITPQFNNNHISTTKINDPFFLELSQAVGKLQQHDDTSQKKQTPFNRPVIAKKPNGISGNTAVQEKTELKVKAEKNKKPKNPEGIQKNGSAVQSIDFNKKDNDIPDRTKVLMQEKLNSKNTLEEYKKQELPPELYKEIKAMTASYQKSLDTLNTLIEKNHSTMKTHLENLQKAILGIKSLIA